MLKYKNLLRKVILQKNIFNHGLLIRRFSQIISIDMGATNTCIAVLEPSGPRVIENAEGLRTTPTIITIDEDGSETLAVVSKRQSIEKIQNSFYGYKFFFGRTFDDEFLKKIIPKYPFKIIAGENNKIKFVNSNNVAISAAESTTKYLAYIKEQAQSLTGKEINKCVLSIPRFINDEGQNEIKESFKNAELEIVEIIDESQAVIKAYNIEKNEKIKNVIVFNFGGSNLSLTYLTRENPDKPEEVSNEFNFKYEKYDFEMGGVDIDKLLVNLLLEEFKKINKMDVSGELYALQRINEAAEKAKIELSLSQQVEISLPFLAADHTGPKHLNMRLARAKFENLIDPITTKLQKTCLEFLEENNITKDKIDEVILLGGVCRIPKIQEIIKTIFEKEGNKNINPEEAAAIGGAIMTKKIVEKLNQIQIFSKMPFALGIEGLGGNFYKLIEKKSKLPIKVISKIKTVLDNQPRVHLKFFLGDRPIANLNKYVGELKMKILKPEKRGQELDLEIRLAKNGDMAIVLSHRLTNKSVCKFLILILAFNGNILGGISKDTISELDAITHQNKDDDTKEFILNKSRIESEKKLAILEKLINDNKEKLLKSKDFNELEMYEDLFLFSQIINENRRNEILDCEETIDENIDYVNSLIHSKI